MDKVLNAYQISENPVPTWARGKWQFGLDCEIDYIDYPDGQRAYWHDWVLQLEDGSIVVMTDAAYRQAAATSSRAELLDAEVTVIDPSTVTSASPPDTPMLDSTP